ICMLLGLVPGIFGLHSPLALICFEAIIPMTVMLGLGLPVTKRYPAYYQRKLGLGPMPQNTHRQDRGTDLESEQIAKPSMNRHSRTLEGREEQKMAAPPTIVAINGSPHEGIGNTFMMIEMLRQPLSKEGFELEVIHLSQNDIGYCKGCGFCLERGKCWIKDDHRGIMERLSDADGIILGSPVYIMHVTAQMKTFLDRSLGVGHKPRSAWKPGLAVCVSAGLAEVDTAHYLANALRIFGGFSVGTFTSIAPSPGEFIGKEAVEARAQDLARDLARSIKEKRRYPATEYDLRFYQFMGDLVKANKDGVMKDDFHHWEKHGLFEGFETYVQQKRTRVPYDDASRQAWIKGMIAKQKEEKKPAEETSAKTDTPRIRPELPKTCKGLLQIMPLGFRADAAEGLNAIYQFEVSGSENFVAHLKIEKGACTYQDGPADQPNVTIKTPADIWLAISMGEMDGQQAFMGGKYTVEGDLSLLMKLKALFSSR
ncbi:MAG: NAD(P)H-dependent oxidoreductase, partial [Deltaproteobacteria bacterium]|nr:NAD(P)H-dependent oxidoreductase [Deltaproteobacteria bacterium]